jgi:hypothetical protein
VQPLVEQAITPGGQGYQTKPHPELIVDEVFMPYFEDRMNVREESWKPVQVF